MSRFTTDPGADLDPTWSPDGKHIAFASQGDQYEFYRKDTSGAENQQSLLSSADSSLAGANARVEDWSPDGRFLLFRVQGRGTSFDLWVLPLEGDRKSFVYLQSEFLEAGGRFSPDGRWVAYVSDESGRMETYVRPFPAADRKWQISTQGGSAPVWSKDGRALYYIDPGLNLMAVPLKAGDTMDAGAPQALFQTRLVVSPRGNVAHLYDVSRDGRFLIASRIGEGGDDDEGKLVLISDWRAKVGR
jgi:Tol biopolymer transport system component